MWAGLALFLVFWLSYWLVAFDYMRTKANVFSINDVSAEITARILGGLGSLFSGLLLFPALRISIWASVFSMPYERMLKYHRILGCIAYGIVTLHACCWWGKWWKEGNLGHNIFAFNNIMLSDVRVSNQDFTTPIMETIWFLMTLSLLMAAFSRRAAYAIFQYSHKLIGIIYYIAIIVHGWSTW